MSYKVNNIENSTPPGSVIAYYGSSDPTGWVICNGAARSNPSNYINLTNMGIGSISNGYYYPPNLSGMFLRGSGASYVSNNYTAGSIGAVQLDEIHSHTHNEVILNSVGLNLNLYTHSLAYSGQNVSVRDFYMISNTSNYVNFTNKNDNTTFTGGTETRPINVAINWIMKI